jgi:hypothetical protein
MTRMIALDDILIKSQIIFKMNWDSDLPSQLTHFPFTQIALLEQKFSQPDMDADAQNATIFEGQKSLPANPDAPL